MSCFSTVSNVTANNDLDLTKHVNFTAGMILGVDDFTQEFAYLSGRDRWLARDALGYGTISGLSIKIEKDGEKNDLRVMVQPGVAVSPRGQFICVPTAQCAYLNQWLAAADQTELEKFIRHNAESPPSSPPISDELTLYVVLCYRDCATDNVPIPGEPCRSEDELTAASRVKDDFSLELRFESPKHAEEKAVRTFVEWLKQITITDSGASTPPDDFVEAIRDEWLKPATSPPVITSPPTALQIKTEDFCEYMRTAFRLWVTELRNVLSERKTGCAVEMTGGNKMDDCVLLTELRVPLVAASPNWKVSDTEEIEQIEGNRPFLLHLRMLQEWMLCGNCNCAPEMLPPVTSPPIFTSPSNASHVHSLDSLSDVTTPSPTDGQHLVFRRGEWLAEDQPIIPVGSPPTSIALDNLTDVTTPSPSEGQVLVFRGAQWIAETSAAGGDLTGDYPNPTINLLQGKPVQANAPNTNDMLVWNGTAWTPQPQNSTTPAAKPQLILPLATITRIGERVLGNTVSIFYEIWFNVEAPGNLVEIQGEKLDGVTIFEEVKKTPNLPTTAKETFLVSIKPNSDITLVKNLRNVFQFGLDREAERAYMRFRFNLSKIGVRVDDGNPVSLEKYAADSSINFSGYPQEKKGFATIFVRGSVNRG